MVDRIKQYFTDSYENRNPVKDHDLGAFVSIGTGTVSEDGMVIASDPGVGVIKAGWHCGGNPSPTGDCNNPPNPNPDPGMCNGHVCPGGGRRGTRIRAKSVAVSAAERVMPNRELH